MSILLFEILQIYTKQENLQKNRMKISVQQDFQIQEQEKNIDQINSRNQEIYVHMQMFTHT